MCEYCRYKDRGENYYRGDDGILYNQNKKEYYLFIEHFRDEQYRIPVNFCPICGRKLKKKDEL